MTGSLAGLLVGRTLCDRYLIDELIGRGGMSLVYRARDLRLHRPVAVKVISLPSDSENEHLRLRERLRREAAAAARVPPHPNVVQIYDYGTDESLDLDFIAMELLDGRDLKSILRGGALVYDEGIRILLETARGLSAGHRAGVVHRDVKPANIVVTEGTSAGTVKLLDFGIAKALETAMEDDLTRTGHAPHSPGYASPEQLQPGRPVGPASDVYQLGLVAYETLAGRRWGEHEDSSNGQPGSGRWMAIPEGVRTVIQAALRPDPSTRYSDAAAFAEALSRAADERQDTVFLPLSPVGEEDHTTLFGSEVPITPPATPAEEITGAATAASPRRRPGRRVVLGILVLLVAIVALRALSRLETAERTGSEDALAPDIEALDEEFRDLVVQAHENLQERGEELSQ